MTKEEFIKKVTIFCRERISSREFEDLEELFYEFFESNVVIPKGENRHPDADLFHRAIEDLNLRLESDRWAMTWKEDECIFYKSGVIDKKALIRYRIKPSEPVYEWQWEFTYNGLICRTGFYTYEQIKAYMYNIKVTKIEETKRERK